MFEQGVRAGAVRVCPHSSQSGIAERYGLRLLATLRCALCTNRRRCFRCGYPTPLLDCNRFVAESSYSTLGDFQFIELLPQLCAFGIEPRQLLGHPPLLSSDL